MRNTDLCKSGSRYCPFGVTDFYFSYISFHAFSVVFLRTMMFLLQGYVSPFKILKIMSKWVPVFILVAIFLGKDTILGNSVKIRVQYN